MSDCFVYSLESEDAGSTFSRNVRTRLRRVRPKLILLFHFGKLSQLKLCRRCHIFCVCNGGFLGDPSREMVELLLNASETISPFSRTGFMIDVAA
jgi:hypothetical protein